MLNALEEKTRELLDTARQQQDAIARELNGGVDALTVAITTFNDRMQRADDLKVKAREIMRQAEAVEHEARDAFNTELMNANAVSLAVIQQMQEGRMVEGSTVPGIKRLRAVKS